jgi:hypothetical protein
MIGEKIGVFAKDPVDEQKPSPQPKIYIAMINNTARVVMGCLRALYY